MDPVTLRLTPDELQTLLDALDDAWEYRDQLVDDAIDREWLGGDLDAWTAQRARYEALRARLEAAAGTAP